MPRQPLERIAEGREAEVFAWDDGWVLRLFRTHRSDEVVAREAAAMTAVRALAPLVPAVIGPITIDGRQGLILERIDGPDLMTVIGRRPWTIRRNFALTARLQAQLHAVLAPPSLPPLKTWIIRRIENASSIPGPIAERALASLASLPDGEQLLHGDLHPANILISAAGPVVIDWPNAARGDPTGDLARTIVMLRASPLPPGTPKAMLAADRASRGPLIRSYIRAYASVRPVDRELLARWLLVRAVDRLSEEIPGERSRLLIFVQSSGKRWTRYRSSSAGIAPNC